MSVSTVALGRDFELSFVYFPSENSYEASDLSAIVFVRKSGQLSCDQFRSGL